MPRVDNLHLAGVYKVVLIKFCIHCKIDRHLAHVDDKMPVAIATADDEAHESHEVVGLAFNIGWRALQCVHAHLI